MYGKLAIILIFMNVLYQAYYALPVPYALQPRGIRLILPQHNLENNGRARYGRTDVNPFRNYENNGILDIFSNIDYF